MSDDTGLRGAIGLVRAMVACALVAGCAELREAQPGVCGNGFVEPAAGEDCDGDELGSAVCRPPGALGECRYDCSAAQCPSGMRCGADGICRAASGAFVPAPIEIAVDGLAEIGTADLDGDQRDDVVADFPREALIHYFDAAGNPSGKLRLPTRDFDPIGSALGDLSGDGLSDAAVCVTIGAVVQLGSFDRGSHPTAYPSFMMPKIVEDTGVIALDALPDLPGDEVLAVGTILGVHGIAYVNLEATVTPEILTTLPGPFSSAIAPIAVGQLDAATPCEQLVIAYEGDSQLYEFSPCRAAPSGGVELNVKGNTRSIALPEGRVATTSYTLLDLNADDRLDLVVAARAGAKNEIDVAYAVGDGSFDSEPTVPAASGNDQLGTYAMLDGGPPLAFGDLDGDGMLDWVHAAGVHVSSNGKPRDSFANANEAWTQARIAALNGGTSQDVVAADGSGQLLFLNGAGDGTFATFEISSRGAVRQLAIGDLDGDFVNDLVLSYALDQNLEMLAIAYGNVVGAPTSLESIGEMDPVRQLVVARGHSHEIVDAIDDLVVVTQPPSGLTGVSGIGGTTTRELRAPYVFSTVDPGATGASVFLPQQLAIADFTLDGALDLAALTQFGDQEIPGRAHRLFVIPMSNRARVGPDALATIELPADVDWSRAQMIVADLDGAGTPEIVLLAGTSFGVAHTLLEQDAPLSFESAVTMQQSEISFVREFGHGGAIASDLDDDGDTDVLAIGELGAGEPVLGVLWNDAGTLSAPSVVSGPAGFSPSALTAIHVGGRERVLVLANGSVNAVKLTPHHALEIEAEPVLLMPGQRMAAGDVTGDGVDDLVLADQTALSVFRGLARNEPAH